MSDMDTMTGHNILLTDLQQFEPSWILIMLLTGKVIMNIFIFWARSKNISASLMGYFCISLAGIDFTFLLAISAIYYFQDFSILGFRVTCYHICLFTQIISHTYGISHYPIFLLSGMDYFFTILKPIKILEVCPGLLYTICVLLLWTGAFTYVLQSPVDNFVMDKDQPTNQCNLYISSQSFQLSVSLVFAVLFFLAFFCSEIMTLLKTMKITKYANNAGVLLSLPPGDRWPVQGDKRFIAALLFSFLGSWAPFLLLQIIIVAVCAYIPGYMDMNIPWLYFMNSFLIGVMFGLKYPALYVTENTFSKDPFVSWKYCVLPFLNIEHKRGDPVLMIDEFSTSILII